MSFQIVTWNWEAPGKQHVHKSVDLLLALRNFLQGQFLTLIMSKYLGFLYCRWSRAFLLLSSDSQIRKKPVRKVFYCVTCSHGHNQIGKKCSLLCRGVKHCTGSCYDNRGESRECPGLHPLPPGHDSATAGCRFCALPQAYQPSSSHFLSGSKKHKRMREILIVVQGQGKVKQSTYQKTDN